MQAGFFSARARVVGEHHVGPAATAHAVAFGVEDVDAVVAGASGRRAVVAGADAGLLVVDIGARDSPREIRGVNTPGSNLITSRLMGVIRDDARTREEFLRLARGD